MNGVLRLLTKKFPVIQLKASSFHNGYISTKIVAPVTNNVRVPTHAPKNDISEEQPSKSLQLPALDNPREIYTFPTLNRTKIIEPFISSIIEKADPTINISIDCPSSEVKPELSLAPRLLTIRRKKMKKHKRRKRYDRDFFKYQKYHREKKLKAERDFLKRMKNHLAELDAFDSEKYVRETITEAKKEWSDELAPTGRKLYPHWSRLMTLEELYGLPKDDYIDKKAGFPSEEDLEKIKSLKLEYANKFRKRGTSVISIYVIHVSKVLYIGSTLEMFPQTFLLFFLFYSSLISAEENFEDSRCRCLCPSTAYFVRENSSNPDNHRRFYTKTNVNPGFCNPQNVVKPEVVDDVVETHIDAFLANCNCKYESRNSVMLKVVVNFIIIVIFVLVAYMAFLVCLEPIFKKKRHEVPYRHQNDDMEDNIFARPTTNSANSSEPNELASARSRNSIPNVLDRVEAEQNKWKKQVEVQRRNIFEDHTMLN